MNPDPIPTPGGTATAAANAGSAVWNQSAQLAQLANSTNGITPSGAFLISVLCFGLAVAAGVLAFKQTFTAGDGNTEKARKQSVKMIIGHIWGAVAALGFSVVMLGVSGFFIRMAFSG